MEKLKVNIYVPSKDFDPEKGTYKYITVTIKDVNKDGEVLFEADMPQHVFDRLKNTSEGYKTKDQGGSFRKKVSLSNYKYLVKTICDYCLDAEKTREIEQLEKNKKLFISFNFGNRGTRHEWCGAGTGNRINIGFQYFVGYRTSTMRTNLRDVSFGEISDPTKKTEFVRYVSEYYQFNKGAAGKYKEGTLQPLHYDWKHETVENAYKIIDWTQERKDFLQEIEDKFDSLGNKLNEFLGDLDTNKLDHLIENKQNF